MSRRAHLCVLLLAIAALLALRGLRRRDARRRRRRPRRRRPRRRRSSARRSASMDDLPGVLKTPAAVGREHRQAPAAPARDRAAGAHRGGPGRRTSTSTSTSSSTASRSRSPTTSASTPTAAFISPLHTHLQTEGVLHVESPTQERFSLGQFFAVWGVRLDATCLGGECAGDGKQLRAWVNGMPVAGDPTRIVLDEHQEIVHRRTARRRRCPTRSRRATTSRRGS